MKSALIAAVVAAIVSATAATATTSIVITGAQIKDGSVQAKDLSAKTRRSLRGQRGPRGFRAAPGAQGAQGFPGQRGDPGSPGLNGGFDPNKLQYITGPDTTIAPGLTGSAEAVCPPNTAAVSGGFFSTVGHIAFSETFGPTFHAIFVVNDSGIEIDIHATVVCSAR